MQQVVSPTAEPKRAEGELASRDAVRSTRLRVVAAILGDSCQGTQPYVERYNVQRGAE
jgi:hypothetical protein